MYVTNLTNNKLGINGYINLGPRETNRYINNKDTDLVARVLRLEAAKLVSVIREEGLTKKTTGKVVKSIGMDSAALSTAPRTKAKAVKAKVEAKTSEATAETKEEVKTEAKAAVKTSTRRRTVAKSADVAAAESK